MEQKRCRLAAEDTREIVSRYLKAYGSPLETVTYFKYLGRILTTSDDDWTEFVGNLRKAWKNLARLLRILEREGDITRLSGMFFKAGV